MGADRRTAILFVHHRSELGGAPASLYYLIRELDRNRFDPHVYCPPGRAAELFRDAGATIHTGSVASFTHIWASVYRGRRWLLFVRELTRLPKHLVQFRRTLRRNRYDLVHLNDSPLIPAGVLARRRGLPVVWHLRAALPGDGRDRRSRLIRRALSRIASASLAINEDVAAIFDIGSAVVPNAIDLDRFVPGDPKPARVRLGLDPDRPVVSYFGFLYPSKGFREFIEAAALLRVRDVDATFLIVGGAVRSSQFFRTIPGRVLQLFDLARDYEREAHALVEGLDLGGAVRFIPFTREPEEIYRASDVVVAPSRGSELGRPVIEAAASGVPVVASGSRTGGGLIVPGETGVLIGRADSSLIADAVERLLGDPERLAGIGRAARAHAVSSFDPSANARRVERIYDELLVQRQRLRVLYVDPAGPSLRGSVARLIASLGDSVEAHVLLSDPEAADLYRATGAIVHEPDRARLEARGSLRPNNPRLRRVIRAGRIDVVHLFDEAPFEAWLARRSGARVVWEVPPLRSGPRSRLTLAQASAVITRDPALADQLNGSRPVEIVAHDLDLDRFRPRDPREVRGRLGLDPDALTIGLAPGTGPSATRLFLRATRLARRAAVDAQFVILGAEVAEGATPDGVVRVATDVERSEYLAALDVAVLPDQRAPGLAEALASGVSVVACSSPYGHELVVPEESAILIPPQSPALIAAAVGRLAADPELRARLGAAARERAEAQAGPRAAAERVLGFYERIRP